MSSGRVAKKRMTLNIPERAKIVLAMNVNLSWGGGLPTYKGMGRDIHRATELGRIQKM